MIQAFIIIGIAGLIYLASGVVHGFRAPPPHEDDDALDEDIGGSW